MKTQNKKLCLIKNSVLELNDNKLNSVNGGSITSITSISISPPISIVVVAATIKMGADMAHNWFHGDE